MRRADGMLGIVRRAQTRCSWATWDETSWEGTKGSARRVSHFPGTLEMNKLIFRWAITLRASLMIHGHGQGASRSLEKVLIKFQQGEHCVTTLELGRFFIWGDQLVRISVLYHLHLQSCCSCSVILLPIGRLAVDGWVWSHLGRANGLWIFLPFFWRVLSCSCWRGGFQRLQLLYSGNTQRVCVYFWRWSFGVALHLSALRWPNCSNIAWPKGQCVWCAHWIVCPQFSLVWLSKRNFSIFGFPLVLL